MINPRVQCDETASPVMVDARETTVLENNDWVIFLVETRDAGVPGDSKAP